MSARLTVVFDDDTLYREAKVRAARDGVALKDLISTALREYLGKKPRERKRLTLEMLDEWQAESRRIDAQLGVEYPTDLSDVKHHLYGWRKQSERYAAEEQAPYGP